jgi:hypothetical protein
MNRVNLIFLALLSLATLSMGFVWKNAQSILTGSASLGLTMLVLLSGLVFLTAILCLGRILYVFNPRVLARKEALERRRRNDKDAN